MAVIAGLPTFKMKFPSIGQGSSLQWKHTKPDGAAFSGISSR